MRAIRSACLGAVFCGAGALFFGAFAVQAASYSLDTTRTDVVVQVFKGGMASSLAHDHVIKATQVGGKISYDPANPGASTVQVDVRTQGLKADDPTLRKQYKLPPMPDSDKEQVETNMKGTGQLEVNQFPLMRFQSKKVTPGATPGQLTVQGELTLHGVTKTVSFPATISVEGSSLTGRAKLTLKQSDYGIAPFSIMMGAIRNQDEVILNLTLVGQEG